MLAKAMARTVPANREKGKQANETSFKPGKSGNPTGRPKLPEDIKHVRELAREYTADAVTTLVSVMKEGSGPAKVAAAQAILDRGWGKPSQPVDGDGEGGAIKHSVRVIFE